ncbi:MAG: type II secretion system protein [Planctomycetota bacterium]
MRLLTRRRRGSTLILVLIVATLLSMLAFSTGDLARYSSNASLVERDQAMATYQCEAALEALRLQLIRHYEGSQMAPRNWLQAVQDDHNYRVFGTTPSSGTPAVVDWTAVGLTPLSPPPGSAAVGAATYTALPGVRAWIDMVNFQQGWIEIVAGTEAGTGDQAGDDRTPVSVRMRLNIYRNAIFDLVMLTETTNCMFCHLHIKGDVGSIGFFRPGWGNENGGGRNSGNGSRIDGDVYIGDIASDDSESNWGNNILEDFSKVNGNDVTGSLFENYRGPYLPEDTIGNDGIPDFPSFDPAEAENRANNGGGGITVNGGSFGGLYSPTTPGMWIVPFGADWDNGGGPGSGALAAPPASTSVIDGNLVIQGSDDPTNPIKIDKNVFVKGDVIIKGYVEGQGAIYAGRNIYVAGDIHYKDLPSGGYPLADDAAGQQAVQEKVSELRLAARSNVVIGDWTYADDAGNPQRVAERQGQDFMKAQFNLDAVRYYEAANDGSIVSNELKQDGANFINDLGETVPVDRVVRMNDTAWFGNHSGFRENRYEATIAPGNLVRTGSTGSVGGGTFDPWISQKEFREVLGQGQYDVVTFRVPGTGDTAKRAYELGSDWVGAHGTNLPGAQQSGKSRWFDEDVLQGGEVGMLIEGGNNNSTWKAALIAKAGEKVSWTKQIEHIDAFLFANKRIGGKSDLGNMTVNGGMAAAEIGVLAPGFRQNFVSNSNRVSGSDTIQSWVFNLYNTSHATHPKNKYGVSTSKTQLYYDYRLRNGGFGFDFLAKTGDTVNYLRQGRVGPPQGGGPSGLNLFPTQ